MQRVPRTGPNAVNPRVGSNVREHGGDRSRFQGGASHHADRAVASLRPDHPAVQRGESLFHKSVVDPRDSPRVLVSGYNNAKLGRTIERGAWSGMPIYQLTLEERATCPRTCAVWDACYGNTMHLARRHKHGPALIDVLGRELAALAAVQHDFAVRLHVLGDFYSTDYVAAWRDWMHQFPGLRVWGYTARPFDSPIGAEIAGLNADFPLRWVIRFSVEPDARPAEMQAAAIWRQPEGPRVAEGLVCPQQFDKTATCGTCGLCWAPASRGERIIFVGHGRNSRGKAKKEPAMAQEKQSPARMKLAEDMGELMRRLGADASRLMMSSVQQELDDQWAALVELEKKVTSWEAKADLAAKKLGALAEIIANNEKMIARLQSVTAAPPAKETVAPPAPPHGPATTWWSWPVAKTLSEPTVPAGAEPPFCTIPDPPAPAPAAASQDAPPKPVGPLPGTGSRSVQASPHRAYLPAPKVPAPAPSPPAKMLGEARSEQREKRLRDSLAEGVQIALITIRLNILPGPRMTDRMVSDWIADLKLLAPKADSGPPAELPAPTGKQFPIDFNTAVRWGHDQKLDFPPKATDAVVERIINTERASQGLPLWRLTEPRRARVSLHR